MPGRTRSQDSSLDDGCLAARSLEPKRRPLHDSRKAAGEGLVDGLRSVRFSAGTAPGRPFVSQRGGARAQEPNLLRVLESLFCCVGI